MSGWYIATIGIWLVTAAVLWVFARTDNLWLYWLAIALGLMGWVFWYMGAVEPPQTKVIVIRA